jgi:hypothetical protein
MSTLNARGLRKFAKKILIYSAQKENESNNIYWIWKYNLIEAPIIIGKAHNWKALRRPTASAIQPLSKHPKKAPPRHMLTTRPTFEINHKKIEL